MLNLAGKISLIKLELELELNNLAGNDSRL